MKLRITAVLLIIFGFIFFIESCNNSKSNGDSEDVKVKEVVDKQLNITILLDLSDRIDLSKKYNGIYKKNNQKDRDLKIVKNIVDFFKNDMITKGAYNAKGKIKVLFSPIPSNSDINTIASNLIIDCSDKSIPEKKEILNTILGKFEENLSDIYDISIKKSTYIGSDIWRFFKDEVKQKCIEKDSSYRNILVLVTDGYIYHKNSTEIIEKRSMYLLPKLIEKEKINLVGNSEIVKDRIRKYDYGYISTGNNFKNLEVLVTEILPIPSRLDDKYIIEEYLKKWFNDMGIMNNNFEIFNSELPAYTKEKVLDFFNND